MTIDMSQFFREPLMEQSPSGSLTTAMGFYEVPDFTIQVTGGHPVLTCRVTDVEHQCELANLTSYPMMLYGYRFGKQDFKNLPIVHATPNMHYLGWHLANIAFKVVATAEKTGLDVDVARLEFNRIYKICVGWGASLVTAKRLQEAKSNMAKGKPPYSARQYLAKMFGTEAIYYRLAHSSERMSGDGVYLDQYLEDTGGIDDVVRTMLGQNDQLEFTFDTVEEVQF